MEKYLIVDVGNSIISFAIFSNEKIEHRLDVISELNHVLRLKDFLASFIKDKKIKTNDIKDGLICSVVPFFNGDIKKAIKLTFGVELKVMDSSYFEHLEMIVDDRKEVGGDIAADVMAAKSLFGGPAFVCDLGTITKNIVLDKDNVFVGVSFFPGVQACISAMRDKTALLPEVELKEKPAKLLGNNTLEALGSGVFYATLSGIKAYGEQIEAKYGKSIKKILTGGNSALFAPYLDEYVYEPDLVLKGIYFLFNEHRG